MLNGKLSIERADNGWLLSWYATRDQIAHREVFTDAHACVSRITEVAGIEHGASAARAFLETAQAHGSADPSVDPDIAALMPAHAPQTCYAGD